MGKSVNTEKKDMQLPEVFPNQLPRSHPHPSAQPRVLPTSDGEATMRNESYVDPGEINRNILEPNEAPGDERLEDVNQELNPSKNNRPSYSSVIQRSPPLPATGQRVRRSIEET